MSTIFPNILYRAYKKKEYAEEFVFNGKFRLGKLQMYHCVEDKNRIDQTEGQGHYLDTNGIHEHFELGNDVYLLSLSTDEVDLDYLEIKMGGHIVKINDSNKLAQDIEDYLNSSGYVTFGGIKGNYIKYNKGETIGDDLDEMDRAILSVTQKPTTFEPECEFRLFTILNTQRCTPPSDGYIKINFGKSLDYAEIIRKII